MRPLPARVLATATRQRGVISREQSLRDLSPGVVRWLLERGQWRRLWSGIYCIHGGPLTWEMRAHAALLHAGDGATLALEAAAFLHRFRPNAPAIITVAVPETRRVRRLPGTRVLRWARWESRVVRGFPVTDGADTVLTCAAQPLANEREIVAMVADAIRVGSVTAPELADRLRRRKRHPRRRVVELAIGDVAEGAESILEVLVVRRVLRAHRLPEMACQSPEARRGTRIRRDFENSQYGIILEMDGSVGHEGSGRLDDLRRDRHTARSGRMTLRAGWVDAYLDPCDLALDLFETYAARGYRGDLAACSTSCVASARRQWPTG